MNDLDLTEATDFAWRAWSTTIGTDRMEAAVAAAAPFIAAQVERRVRETIANDIQAIRSPSPFAKELGIVAALESAARVARGGAA